MFYANSQFPAVQNPQIKWGGNYTQNLFSAIVSLGAGGYDLVKQTVLTRVSQDIILKYSSKFGVGLSSACVSNVPSAAAGQSRYSVLIAFTYRSIAQVEFLYNELGTNDPHIDIFIDASANLVFRHYNNSFGSLSITAPFVNGQSYVIIATYDSVRQVKQIFINGALAGTNNGGANANLSSTDTTGPRIMYDGTFGYFNNSVHAVFTWRNRIITEPEAKVLAANPFLIFRPPSFMRQEFFAAENINLQIGESIAIVDDVNPGRNDNYLFSDSFSITDSAFVVVPIDVLASDDFSISDDPVVGLLGFVDLLATDSIEITDGLLQELGIQVVLTDALSLGDVFAYAINNFFVIQTSDSLFIFDSVRFQDDYAYNDLGDDIEFGDQAVVQLGMNLSFGDSFAIDDSLDSINPPTVLTLQIGESVALSDSVSLALNSSFASSIRRYLNDVPSPRS